MEPSPRLPFSVWMQAARPKTLPAAAAPVLIALALAWRDEVFNLPAAIACLLISLLMQIGANFANDLFDHQRGADTPERLGPTRVTASGLISPSTMLRGVIFIFGLAALLGLYLIYLRGWPVLALGLAILLAALAYTGGPFPYGYYALGDVFVFLAFGIAAVCGSYYAQSGLLTPVVWWAAVPPWPVDHQYSSRQQHPRYPHRSQKQKKHPGRPAGSACHADRVPAVPAGRLSRPAWVVAGRPDLLGRPANLALHPPGAGALP